MIRAANLPVAYLAREAGIGRETLSRWLDEETGMPRIDTMLKVAKALGRHIELTGRVGKMVGFYPPPKPSLSRHAIRTTLLRLQ